MTVSIAGMFITYNEELVLYDALASLRRVTTNILVVDSGSTDDTVRIAESCGAVVRQRDFDGYATQRNYALNMVESLFAPTWTVVLDADEFLDEELIEELQNLAIRGVRQDPSRIGLIRRDLLFSGRRLRWGASRVWLARLIPFGIRYASRQINENIEIDPRRRCFRLSGAIVHQDVQDWARYVDKQNRYSTAEAVASSGKHLSLPKPQDLLQRRDRIRGVLRSTIWPRIPCHPLAEFLFVYLLRLGLLDGRAGLNWAIFRSWHELCIDLKMLEGSRRGV